MNRTEEKNAERGMTLIEIMISITLLCIAALFLAQADTASMNSTWKAREYQAAARAAREKLEELQLIGFANLTTALAARKETVAPYRTNPFKVLFNFNATGTQAMDVAMPNLNSRLDKNSAVTTAGFLPGLVDDYAGEIVLIDDETKPASAWGSDLLAPAGPDGVKFASLPFDIDLDGAYTSSSFGAGNPAYRYLVGVVIRWNGKSGPERFEQWTVLSKY